MTEIKKINAKGNHVILKMIVKEKSGEMYKKNHSGIFLPNEEEKSPAVSSSSGLELDHALVHDIGPKVESPDFAVGDRVVFNEYDIKYVGSKENMFGIVKSDSVMAVYDVEK